MVCLVEVGVPFRAGARLVCLSLLHYLVGGICVLHLLALGESLLMRL